MPAHQDGRRRTESSCRRLRGAARSRTCSIEQTSSSNGCVQSGKEERQRRAAKKSDQETCSVERALEERIPAAGAEAEGPGLHR